VALSCNELMRRPTVSHHCYRLVTVAMDKLVMSPAPIATEGYNSGGWFGDITEESLQQLVTKCLLLQSNNPPSPVAIETFCSTVKYSNEHMLGFMLILPPRRSRSKSCSWQSSPQQAAMASARAHSSCVIYALVKVGIYFPLYKKMLT
jgi:hypothetical protein